MAYLHELEVSERHRTAGHGRHLMKAFLEAAERAGASKVFLSTSESNGAARRLYETLGGKLPSNGGTVNYWFLLSP